MKTAKCEEHLPQNGPQLPAQQQNPLCKEVGNCSRQAARTSTPICQLLVVGHKPGWGTGAQCDPVKAVVGLVALVLCSLNLEAG